MRERESGNWVVDIAGHRIVVHRDPRGGLYESITSYGLGESFEPLSAPGKYFRVDDAFPDPAGGKQSAIS